MTIFDVYLGREFHATQELEYHEIDDLHIHIGQNIQQQQKPMITQYFIKVFRLLFLF